MITIMNNTGGSSFSSSLGGGVQTSPEATQTTTEAKLSNTSGSNIIQMTELADVNKEGLNHNDVLVFDSLSKTFKPIDIDVINNNDGGTW